MTETKNLKIDLNNLEIDNLINNTSKNIIKQEKIQEKFETKNNDIIDNNIDNLTTNSHENSSEESNSENSSFNNLNNNSIYENELILKNEKEFDKHLQDKLKKLDIRLKLLQKKYHNYKSWYDKLNIMIIIISSFLSIIEALRNELDNLADDSEVWKILFNMIPLSISTFITGTVAIIKFQKYQEKMENMQFTKEKVILAISKIKHIQEIIKFSNTNDFENIKKKYLNDIYSFYNESNSELERQLKSI